MWMVDPKIMCRKHLLGEHNELHAIKGIFDLRHNICGYLRNNLIEPKSIVERHNAIVEEMIKRGYNHNSPLSDSDIHMDYLPLWAQNFQINKEVSKDELFSRCKQCKANA